MTPLLRIELRKQVSTSIFWIMIAVYLGLLSLVLFNFNRFLSNTNFNFNGVTQDQLHLDKIFQFPDIWHNITYIGGYFKIILALILINSVTMEYNFGTLRQNIIEGISRINFVISKLWLALVLALIATFYIIVCGIILATNNGHVSLSLDFFRQFSFVGAYFMEYFTYFVYAIFFAFLFKRSGVALILLLCYDFIFEPIIAFGLPENIRGYLPMKVLDNLIPFPFTKYLQVEIQDTVQLTAIVLVVFYAWLFVTFSVLLLKKSDV